jgi:hypothetical protein
VRIVAAYLAPGVYLRPKRTDLPDVHIVRTDVAGFAGFAERGPLPLPLGNDPTKVWRAEDLAVRLTSWDEFRAVFGGLIPNGYLAYAVRGFFENGGTTCYVVRVAAVDAQDRAERPAFARWAFDAPSDSVFATTLAQAAISGERSLRVAGAVDTQGAMLVDIALSAGGLVERHLLTEVNGSEFTLAGPLRASFPPGSIVSGRKEALVVEAVSAGAWGNRIELRVIPSAAAGPVEAFALRVSISVAGPDRDHPCEEEFYREVSLDPQSAVYICKVVNPRSRLVHVWSPGDPCRGGRESAASATVTSFAAIQRPRSGFGRFRLEGGKDGLHALTADDFGLVDLGEDKLRGLRVLETIDEVSILCVPDAVFDAQPSAPTRPVPAAPCAPPPPSRDDGPEVEPAQATDDATAVPPAFDHDRVYAEMLAQCERRHDRVAILDPEADAQTTALLAWASRFRSRFGAAYAPWLRVADPLQPPGRFRAVPPSGHVAGVYARIDLSEGVHHAPANVALMGVADAVQAFSSAEQERLNPSGINALRAFPGRGVRVWGARSLATDERNWRFIHVRRLLSMLEESVEDSMQWTAFEPNGEALRRTVVHSVSLFLQAVYQMGGLAGALPEQSFYVRCDETNNPQAVVDAGQLVCQVGVAPAAPMEFIVFEVRQKPDGVDIVEL